MSSVARTQCRSLFQAHTTTGRWSSNSTDVFMAMLARKEFPLDTSDARGVALVYDYCEDLLTHRESVHRRLAHRYGEEVLTEIARLALAR